MAEFPTSALNNGVQGHSQVEVCDFCGDRGFSNALINCSECCETLVHQYCLGIPPGSIDDSFNWLCEYCCVRMKCEPRSSTKSGGTSAKGKGKTKKRNRERSPSPLESEIPFTLGSKCKRIRKETTEERSFSGATKVAVGNCTNSEDNHNMDSLLDHEMDYCLSCMVYCDDDVDERPNDDGESMIIPVEDQPEPLLTLLPIACHQIPEEEKTKYGSHLLDCWEAPEGVVSSLMENPEELRKGIVLLVSPSGEILINEDLGVHDEDSSRIFKQVGPYKSALKSAGTVLLVSPSGETFIHEDSGLCDEGLGRMFKQVGPCKSELDLSPTDGNKVRNVSSLMETPEELIKGIVLLVSPSGEIFINEDLGVHAEDSSRIFKQVGPHKSALESAGIVLLVSPSGETFVHEDLGLCDEGLGRMFKQVGPYKSELDSSPTDGNKVRNVSLKKPM